MNERPQTPAPRDTEAQASVHSVVLRDVAVRGQVSLARPRASEARPAEGIARAHAPNVVPVQPARRTEPNVAAPQPQPEPEEEVALRLIQKVDPDIPRQLVSNIRNGSVMVRFQVKPDGSTTKVETLGNPNKRLASSAIAAVQQWKFAPIPKQREATVEIGFKLD